MQPAERPTEKNRSNKSDRGSDERRRKDGGNGKQQPQRKERKMG